MVVTNRSEAESSHSSLFFFLLLTTLHLPNPSAHQLIPISPILHTKWVAGVGVCSVSPSAHQTTDTKARPLRGRPGSRHLMRAASNPRHRNRLGAHHVPDRPSDRHASPHRDARVLQDRRVRPGARERDRAVRAPETRHQRPRTRHLRRQRRQRI